MADVGHVGHDERHRAFHQIGDEHHRACQPVELGDQQRSLSRTAVGQRGEEPGAVRLAPNFRSHGTRQNALALNMLLHVASCSGLALWVATFLNDAEFVNAISCYMKLQQCSGRFL